MNKFGFFLILSLLCGKNVDAQQQSLWNNIHEEKNLTVPSPNAASLGKFSEIAVGHYTGIPDITIPIYTITDGDMTLPIEIKYHAAGIRVDEISSDLGIGWALGAGGTITRSVVGIPDERSSMGGHSFFTEPYTIDSVNRDLKNYTNITNVRTRLIRMGYGKIDCGSDIYHYNFGTKSGKFIYNQTLGKFISLTDPTLEIDFDESTGHLVFEVRDGNGIIYTFSTIEFTPINETQIPHDPIPTSWRLDHIFDPATGRESHFMYEEKVNCLTDVEVSRTHLFGMAFTSTGPMNVSEYSTGKQVMRSNLIKLVSISSGTTVVNFTYDNPRYDLFGDEALSKITVFEYGDIKSIHTFHQSYFNVNGPTANTLVNAHLKRLRLDSLSIGDLDYERAVLEPPTVNPISRYTFRYNNLICPLKSYSQDYWGYYNGSSNSNLFDAATHLGSSFPGANRNVNPYYSNMGMLKEITYPTGATTFFDFESNQAELVNSNKVLVNSYVGGHRIKGITTIGLDKDTISHKYFTYYLANNPNLKSGRAQLYQNYNYKACSWDLSSEPDPRSEGEPYLHDIMKRHSRSMYPLISDQGKGVGYKEVQEYNFDNKSGFTSYKFTSYDDYPDRYGETTYLINDRPVSFDLFRGKLLEMSVYAGNQSVVSKEINTYAFDYDDQQGGDYLKMMASALLVTNGVDYGGTMRPIEISYQDPEDAPGVFPVYRIYPYYKHFVPLKEKKLINYHTNGNDTVYTKYGYNDRLWLANQETSLNSYGDSVISKTFYPVDYPVSAASTDSKSLGIRNLLALNKITVPILATKELKNSTAHKTLSTVYYSYKSDSPFVDTIFTYSPSPTNPRLLQNGGIIYSNNKITRDSDFKPEYIISRYDLYGNIVESKRHRGSTRSVLYGKGYQYPVLIADNLSYDSLFNYVGGNSTLFNLNMNYGSIFRTDYIDNLIASVQNHFKSSMVRGYKYDEYGVNKAIEPNTAFSSYQYDGFGRLLSVLDDENKIVKSYVYKYQSEADGVLNNPKVFYNDRKQQTFTKSNCTGGMIGSSVVYVVPARKYISYVSQLDANNQAQQDITQNGQIYANTNGTCSAPIYWNQRKTQSFTKMGCEEDDRVMGESIIYEVPANTYSSTISVLHANTLADQDIIVNGQAYADSLGVCMFAADIMGLHANDNVFSGISCYDSNNQLVYSAGTHYDNTYDTWRIWLRPGSYSKVVFHFSNLDQPFLPDKIGLEYLFNGGAEYSDMVSTGNETAELEVLNFEIFGYEYGLSEIFLFN
ncbi:hypothetical protein GCM10011418_06430 [Sphingobacterium alkalisoli]|uniref:DUF5977 domain-containing protein n=1 Tax=Sphingobacterium alkalisoli TaxID=1874115 RepID=UPI00145FB8E1|nr:DUF5977 domain-containing protein [Sphingobacterium alkalisoli]GGH08788.1 hypothetical protein GCM10011418_06430 [Sphingobacterium alkalisoli]